MRALAVSLGIAVLAYALIPWETRTTQAQAVPISCWVQSFDAPNIGNENYFSEAISTCDQPVNVISVGSWLYEYNWNDGYWYPRGFLGGDLKANVAWASKSRVKHVEPGYLGTHCVMIASQHVIGQVGYEAPLIVWPSLSPGQCF